MEYVKKFIKMLSEPSLMRAMKWSRCVWGSLAAICVLTAAGTLFQLGSTLVTKTLIDNATSGRAQLLVRDGAMLVGITVIARAARCLCALINIKASAKLQKELQGRLMNELLLKEYSGLKKYHSGELVSRVFSDVGVVKNGILGILPSLTGMLVSFTGSAIILIRMEPRLVPVLLAAALVCAVIMLLFRAPMKDRHKRMQQAQSKLNASVQETLENIRVIKSGLSEKRAARRFVGDQDELVNEQLRQGRFSLCMKQIIGVFFEASWLISMLWGCVNISRGMMTYGSLTAMIQLIAKIQTPILSISDIAAQIFGVAASADRINELYELPVEEDGEPVKEFGGLRFENLGFRYDDGNVHVLSGINSRLAPGDFTAMMGISGSGKTSMFQLILGIYHPTEGRVLFETPDGDVPASRRTRGLIAYVPQGNTLISGTLRENLTLFCGNASDEEIMKAAKVACIDGLVNEIGLGAVLGERGVGLSEGQAQRVSIARAILGGAPVMLLDECTSALDEDTESKVLENIAALKGKTCLIVTHRRKALDICGKVLRVDCGNVLEGENA